MKRTTTGIFMIVMLFLYGCIQKTDWQIAPENQDLVVVNAVITDAIGSQSVSLSSPVSGLNEIPSPISGANVLITEQDSIYHLTEQPASPGIYLTGTNFLAKPGKTYTLQIYYKNNFYTAKAAMDPGFTFNPFLYSKDTDDTLYHIDYVASVFSPDNPAMWEILLDWSGVPGYEGQDTSKCKARLLFYTLTTLDVSEIFAPEVEKIKFPSGTSVTESRYSLAPAHAEFIREMLLETSWQGGIFNSAPANVTTNMSKGATGFFAACSKTTTYFFITP